ncbi:hypothetical protein M758_3G213400 [Ceratodon purpureus]|nr:hypothetical protein M758_3G213400 [Ceratodon purpureus]
MEHIFHHSTIPMSMMKPVKSRNFPHQHFSGSHATISLLSEAPDYYIWKYCSPFKNRKWHILREQDIHPHRLLHCAIGNADPISPKSFQITKELSGKKKICQQFLKPCTNFRRPETTHIIAH